MANVQNNPESTLIPKLQDKVRSQAEELASLYAGLQRSISYSKLVEKKLLEVCPGQQLPVTQAHLHDHENYKPTINSTSRTTTTSDSNILGTTSQNASQRKVEREVSRQLAVLEDKVQALEMVRADLTGKLKECRAQLTTKEKISNSLTRANHELVAQLDDLKSRLSASSNTTSATPTPTPPTHTSNLVHVTKV
jgi:chromosome segregation ATPase